MVDLINPEHLAFPSGYSHGAIGQGKVLFLAGQVAWDKEKRIVSDEFVAQCDQALANLVQVLEAAEAGPEDLVKLTFFVKDVREYRSRTRELGEVYRRRIGRHFPAMTLVEVKNLLEERAKVEIEGVAILSEGPVLS